MIFEELNLNKPILNALHDLDFVYATPVQSKVFPVILSGADLVAVAQTGTGKTLAYLLPLLKQLTYSVQRHPRILILVPTRELVVQVTGEIEKLTKYMNVRYAGVYGGTNINTQKQLVYDGLDILVATPGRLMDLAMTGNLRLKSIQKLVIDEVDEMLKLGFRPQVTGIMEILPEKRQNLMFSATLTNEVEELIRDFFHDPVKIEVSPHGTPLDQINQAGYYVPNFYTKANLLEYLLDNDSSMTKVLVFVSTKKLADRLGEHLEKKFADQTGVIHSNKSQNFRFNVLERFQNGAHRILIATDIIARGLDITDITHVVNFDTPDVPGDYIHRIGRTGRADKDGIAITFINEAEIPYQKEIEKLMKKEIPIFSLPENLEISKLSIDSEKPVIKEKFYIKAPSIKNSKGAFHEKSEKNKKVNSGSPAKKAKKKREKKFR